MSDPEFLPDDVRGVIDLLGMHALGRLDPADDERVRLAAQRSELVALLLQDTTQAAAALGLTDLSHVEAEPDEPGAEVETRIMAAARRERRLRRLRPAAGAVAAGAVAVALFAGGRLSVPEPAAPPLEPVVFVVEEGATVLDADLINHTWGTELVMTVTDVIDGGVYDVAFVDTDGQSVGAGSFLGVADRPVDCRMNAAILRDDVAGLVITGPDGELVLESDLS